MPITMTEFGTPMDCTFRRGHEGFDSNITSEPLLTEFAAIYFGTDAYTSEEPKYRQYLHDLFRRRNALRQLREPVWTITPTCTKSRSSTARIPGAVGGPRVCRAACAPGRGCRTRSRKSTTRPWRGSPGRQGLTLPRTTTSAPARRFQKQIVLINDTRQPQDFTATWTATVGGKKVGKGELHGTLAVSEIRNHTHPDHRASRGGRRQGRRPDHAYRNHRRDDAPGHLCVPGLWRGPAGQRRRSPRLIRKALTSKMLANLGYTTHAWNGATAPLVVIGRNALKDNPAMAARLEPYVRGGGRVLILAQDPDWMTEALGWRVCPKVSRYVFPIPDSPVAQGIDADDLRDWTGNSTLIEAYPKYEGDYLRGNEGSQPYAGWHWGNRGGVSSAAIEKPHRSGWTPAAGMRV